MKYFVFSDLHGSQSGLALLKRDIAYEKPDVLLCLGDISYGAYDQNSNAVREFFQTNQIPIFAVKGNTDGAGDGQYLGFSLPLELTLPLGRKKAYLNHYPVFSGFGPDFIVISGHTHVKMLKDNYGTIYLNPGSIGKPRDDCPSYAIIGEEEISLHNAEDYSLISRIRY